MFSNKPGNVKPRESLTKAKEALAQITVCCVSTPQKQGYEGRKGGGVFSSRPVRCNARECLTNTRQTLG